MGDVVFRNYNHGEVVFGFWTPTLSMIVERDPVLGTIVEELMHQEAGKMWPCSPNQTCSAIRHEVVSNALRWIRRFKGDRGEDLRIAKQREEPGRGRTVHLDDGSDVPFEVALDTWRKRLGRFTQLDKEDRSVDFNHQSTTTDAIIW